MNRRFFLQSLGLASVGGVVACSFPKVVASGNVEAANNIGEIFLYSDKLTFKISDDSYYGFGYTAKMLDNVAFERIGKGYYRSYLKSPSFEDMQTAYKKACERSAEPSAYLCTVQIYN